MLQIIALLTLIGNIVLIVTLGFNVVIFYSLLIGILSISQIFISNYFYKTPKEDKNYYPNLTIIVPAYNEEKTIVETLKSCINSGYPLNKLELITVNDGSNDLDEDGQSRTLKLMYKTRDKILKEIGFQIHVLDLGKNMGKREALVRGIQAASKKSEILVTVDSDSYIKKGAIHKLIQPFKNQKVGAVSGNTEIANINGFITHLQHYMYWVSYTIFKASESFFGTVLCCPGCFSAFRKEDVHKVLHEFRNEKFCNVSEDRNLTNLILNLDKEIIYNHEAIAKTNVPENLMHFIKQQYRWKISTIYENIFVATRFINRRHPFMILNFYISFILIFSWGIAAMYALVAQLMGGVTPWTVLFWLTCMPVFPLYWAWKEKKIQNFAFGFLSLFTWIFLIDQLNYIAFANLRTKKWGGKEDPNANEGKIKKVVSILITPFKFLFKKVQTGINLLPQIKNASKIKSIIFTGAIITVIIYVYYINLRIPIVFDSAYLPAILYYLSQTIYFSLSEFLYQYWVGLIGMIIFGILGSKIIQIIGCKKKASKSLKQITVELYPELKNKEHEEIIKNSIPKLSNVLLQQNDTIASSLFILLNIPYVGKYTSLMMENRVGRLFIKPIAGIIEIFTMLILYRFFLRHFILPLSFSSKYISRMINEDIVKKILIESKNSGNIEKKTIKAKNYLTLQAFLHYLDFKILKWNTKKDKGTIFWSVPLGFIILIRAFTSLIRQRTVIAFIANFIALPIAALLFSPQLLNTTFVELPVPLAGLYPVTIALVVTSFIIVLFLELPRLKASWDENHEKHNPREAFSNWVVSASAILFASTLSMVLIGPELIFALQLTSGIPLLGETVRFMEEFVYGANGQGGIGTKILAGFGSLTGIVNPNPIKDGWTMPETWKMEKNGQGVMPEPAYSLKIDGQGTAFSHLVKIDSTQNYVLQFMADTKSKNSSIDVFIEEFNTIDNKATFINRKFCAHVDSAQGIDYKMTNYSPSSPNVNSARIVIEGTSQGDKLNGYVDGVKLSRITDSTATSELQKPHIILRFDDGWKSQTLQEMKTKDYGYPAVYNLIPNGLYDEATDHLKENNQYMSVQDAYELPNNYQIGTHSVGYANDHIDDASHEKILQETFYQYQILRILGFNTDTYASPNFLYNPDSLRVIYRTFNSHQIDTNYHLDVYKFPFNRYHFETIEPVQVEKQLGGATDTTLLNIDETKQFINEAAKNNATLTLMFHIINKAGDPPESKIEMETTAYNDLLDHIHSKNISVITYQQLMALQEESLSDLSINSFNNDGIKGDEGTYYPMGSVQMVTEDGVLLKDFLTDKDIQPLNIPYLSNYPMLYDSLQTYAKSMNPSDSSFNIGVVPLAAGAIILALLNKRRKINDLKSENEVEGEFLVCKQCNSYYNIKKGEYLDDFISCQCGGELQYYEDIKRNLRENLKKVKSSDSKAK